MNTVKVKALINNIKREHPDLATHFSEYALTEIAKNEITQCSRFTDSIDFLSDMCTATMENQLKSTSEDQKNSLRLLSHTVTVPGTIFAVYSPGLIAYILYKYTHIIKIFEIMKYLILKIINLKVKYFNNYIL